MTSPDPRMPHVSVVIPVFNAAALIGAALRSVFAQTFTDFEVIVVDDGSEDREELAAVLAEFSGRLHYIRQSNGGPAKARNAGIAQTSGELVAFLDADDEWLPEKLARQVEYFRQYPETGLLHTAVVGGTRRRIVEGTPRRAFCEVFHTEYFINTLTVMMPRRVLMETGGFDERREIHVEDWDLWLRVAAQHPLGYISTPLAYHRRGGLMSRQVERTFAAQALVLGKNLPLCQHACALHRADPRRCERARRQVLHRDWGHARLDAGDRRGARAQLLRALAHAPGDRRTLRLYVSSFASDRWRARARKLLGRPDPAATHGALVPVAGQTRPPRTVSMLQDTTYRRLRRGVVGRLHDMEDAVSRTTHRRKRVLFEAASPMSYTIFEPIYERLKRDPRVELWFTSYGSVWEPHQIFGAFGITENILPRSRAAWFKPDAYVNADFWDMTWLYRRTRRIHLFHGVAGKYNLDAPVDLAPTIAAFDCLMFVNGDRRQRYVDAGLVADDDVRAPVVGYPKVDCLTDGSLDREGTARKLGLDQAIPTVIYAPTWSPHSSLNAMGLELVERIAAEGLQVIVKLHDRSYDRRERGSGGVDWAEQFARYDGHHLVRIARDSNGCPFMMAADAMVSDHSSIAFEYMLLDRPLVIGDCPALIRNAGISLEKVKRLRAAADVGTTPTEIVTAVVAALRHPQRLSAERQGTAAELFYKPGTATDRAVELLYRLIGLRPVRTTSPVEADRHFAQAG
jgi:hypothetical protein